MSVTKVKRKRGEGWGKWHNLTSCFAGFNPRRLFRVQCGAGAASDKTGIVTATTRLLLSVSARKCFTNLGQSARSTKLKSALTGFLIPATFQDYAYKWRLHRNVLRETIIILHFKTSPAGLFTVRLGFRADKKQPELFSYDKHRLAFVVDMGDWLQQHLEEETLRFTAPPPTSFLKNWINESQARTLTWLLHHEREATLPPLVFIMLSTYQLMRMGLLAGADSTLEGS